MSVRISPPAEYTSTSPSTTSLLPSHPGDLIYNIVYGINIIVCCRGGYYYCLIKKAFVINLN